jgi:hypothetical protein
MFENIFQTIKIFTSILVFCVNDNDNIFSSLGVRLDEGDFKTIIENPKYKALKFETMQKTEPMVILNPSGVLYLKEKWGLNLNKNGEKRMLNETIKESEIHCVANKQKEMQRLENRMINLVTTYYTSPEK